MHHAHHFHAQTGDPVKNHIVRMHHDLTQSGQALTVFVEIGMFGSLLQVVLNAAQELVRCTFIALGDELQYFQQVSLRRRPPLNYQHEGCGWPWAIEPMPGPAP